MPDGRATLIGPREVCGCRAANGSASPPRGRWCTRPNSSCSTTCRAPLDVETELELWTNLAAAGMTVLAVSHRAIAFERADQVITLGAR